MKINVAKSKFITVVLSILLLSPGLAFAQFSGHNTRGDYGLFAGTQPTPGWYVVAPMYFRYAAHEFRDANGDTFMKDEDDKFVVNAIVLSMIYVSKAKVFGGNYSVQVYPSWSDNNLEIPMFSVDENTSMGFSDLYIQPINLGWHVKQADFTAGLGLYIPTGRYEFLGDGNIGLGMWSFEIFGGTTIYFDNLKKWHVSTIAAYETHTYKKGTDIRVGNVLTLEGGLGWSFFEGAASLGITYFAQWKLSNDDLGSFDVEEFLGELGLEDLIGVPIGKNRVFGIGPQLSIPIPIKKKLVAFIDARYIWDIAARTDLLAQSLIIAVTFPIPSIPFE